MWRCPLCQTALCTGDVWHCPNNHRFDVSKRGYVNLLPVHKKGSKQPGDSKEMLSAREFFHRNGGYQPLMDKVAALLLDAISPVSDKVSLYDAGCGEGTYLHHTSLALIARGFHVNAAGSDIAKSAVEFASRQYKNAQFVVASSFDLPVEDATVDALLQVFAPGDDSELHRIIKPGGVLIHVAPGPDHLWSLKQVAYQTPRKHDVPAELRNGFSLLNREQLSFSLTLTCPEQTAALLMMTPFTWRLSDEKREALQVNLQQVEADFIISVWRRE